MKKQTFLVFLFLSFCFLKLQAQAEPTYRYEMVLGHDNDFTIFGTRTDWHYTYGIHLAMGWRPQSENFISKLFSEKEALSHSIGAHIQAYTPDYARTYQIVKTRQPYAGWGYLDFATNYGFKRSFLQLKIDLGILGPAVQAGEIQNFIHEYFSKDSFVDQWDQQIPNQFGFNLRANYACDIFTEKWLNVYGMARASAGTIFTFIEPGIYFRFGKFEAISKSVARQQSLLGNGATEIFMEAGFNMNFSAFNATIENANAYGEKVVPRDLVNPSILNGHVGVFFAKKRFTIGLKWNYTEGEIEGNKPHRFAILAGTYKFN